MAKTITLDHDFFEHLLNCLCNQKFLPMPGPSCLSSEMEQVNQKFIDDAYHKARCLWIENGKERERMTEQELIEKLADAEHASWARWMEYFFSKCEHNPDGSLTVPLGYVEALNKQIGTSYTDLLEQERQGDRDEVAHILPIIEAYANPGKAST